MIVILSKDIRGLGRAGEIKEVSDGFARNFLLPKKLAEIGTADSVARSAEHEANSRKQQARIDDQARKLLEKLRSQTPHFALPADSEGHLYAGLKESEILAKLSVGDDALQKTLKLQGYTPIKRTGEHEVTIKVLDGSEKKLMITITQKK